MTDISDKLYISTIADDAAETAREYGLGLEIAEFTTAFNMDEDFKTWNDKTLDNMKGVERFIFHAPFNELCPAAIDPLIAGVAKVRYNQAYDLMTKYGVNTMIVHSGFMPDLYDEGWFTEKSIGFWKNFLAGKPAGFKLFIENTFERSPGIMSRIIRAVRDQRFGMCLDIGHTEATGKGVPLIEWVEQTIPLIRHVHLHNNYGESDSHNALCDGNIDVAAAIGAITEAAPDATFTIEARHAKTSAEWLRAGGFLQRVGQANE